MEFQVADFSFAHLWLLWPLEGEPRDEASLPLHFQIKKIMKKNILKMSENKE